MTETTRNKLDRAGRELALQNWYATRCGAETPALQDLAGDASFRRYFRVGESGATRILCDSPPETEKNREFLAIAGALARCGVRVPRVFDADTQRGFFLLEDLGDQSLLPCLDEHSVDGFYAAALAMLRRLAIADPTDFALPLYDRAALEREMALFPRWFCAELLQWTPDDEERQLFAALCDALCARALSQTRVVVHRDFHSRNLMVLADGSLAAIDFQDAVLGPVTYDPVSLLRDCYLRWPEARVRDWALAHHRQLLDIGVALPDAEAFLVDFDWMGLQRHIKVLGIFARLYLRDGKAGYLADLPRVLRHVRTVLARYPEDPALWRFAVWFEDSLMPRVRREAWYAELEDS